MSIVFPLSLLGSLAYLGDLGIVIALHFLPTGYNPVQHAVSDYAIGKYHRLFRVRLWLNALGSLALAAALWIGLGTPPLSGTGLVLLALLAPVRVAITLFPTDIEGKPRTRAGIVHYLLAVLSFAFVYIVLSDITPTLQAIQPWKQVQGPLTFLAAFALPALVAVVVTLLLPYIRRIFGLCERLFLLTTSVWLTLVSILLAVKMI